jgi:hypothetical protein
MDDLDFINSSMASLLLNLKENFRLIERDEQFHNLVDTESQFCEILNELDHGEGSFSGLQYPELRERVGFLISRSQERQRSIDELIIEAKNLTLEPVVSYDELHELLSH